MKKIRVQFADQHDKYDTGILNLLKKHYDVEISDNPDFLFYNTYGCGMEHYKYRNCIKIFCTGEFVYPNFNECDYAIGMPDIQFEDRYCRYFYLDKNELLINRTTFRNTNKGDIKNKKFCNFIYNNSNVGEGAVLRQEFCKRLMEYRHVDCPGKVLNNMPAGSISDRYENCFMHACQEFQRDYKFTIAFENVSANGYVSEKIVNPFIAGSVPIYWGDPDIENKFNSNAFIKVTDDMDAVINKIIETDQNDDLWYEMVQAQPLKDMSLYTTDWDARRDSFILDIIENGTPLKQTEQLPNAKSSNYILSRIGWILRRYDLSQTYHSTLSSIKNICIR